MLNGVGTLDLNNHSLTLVAGQF